MGLISGLRPLNVRSDGFRLRPQTSVQMGYLGPSALKRPLRWVSSRAFGPQTSARRVSSRAFGLKTHRMLVQYHSPKIQTPVTWSIVGPNFLEKIFLYSTHQGLSNDISFDPLYSFLGWAIFGLKILGGFISKIFKKS